MGLPQDLLVTLKAVAQRAGAFARLWFWPSLAVLLVIFFIVTFVRPLSSSPDPNSNDVASAWNLAIARLGILPVFPPEEDLQVGDVWAVVSDSEDTPLLGKAVRIAHLDLRKEMQNARIGRPTFVDTVDLKQNETFRRQDPKEVSTTGSDDGRISMTLTGFPGITITHATKSSGSLAWSIAGFGAGRDDQQIEEIRILTAETYGVSAPEAFFRLDAWCRDTTTKIYCTDDFVRRVLAFAVTDRVLTARNGHYISRLQIRLVTRVFLTREIEHRRVINAAHGAFVQISTDGGKAGGAVPPTEGAARPENSSLESRAGTMLNTLTQTTQTTTTGAAAKTSIIGADGTEISLHEVFQRPVAFGFRAITISLPPADPAQRPPP